jgi:N,N'-diacetyllegionaminate synthase
MFVIAEIAQAHEGSLGIAHSYIDAIAETGVNAIKFQTHIAHAESSEHEPFRTKFSYEDKTRYDYWKRMEFTEEQWVGLKQHCEDKSLEFMSTPFSNAAIDLLEKIGVGRYKIGSGEVSNFLMLEKVAQTSKPIILSSGMSSWAELDSAVAFLKERQAPLSILQCTTSYPTTPKVWGLNVIGLLKERYNIPVGFSDHSGNIYAGLSAAALGAEILEFHAVFDKQIFGPDASSSLDFKQIEQLMLGLTQWQDAKNNPVDKSDNSQFGELKSIFEKSLAVNQDLQAGHIICADDLEAKKPKGYGLDASQYQTVIGKPLNKNMKAWSFLNLGDCDD